MNGELVHFSEYISIHSKALVEAFSECEEQENKEAESWNSKHYQQAKGACPFCKIQIANNIANRFDSGDNPYETKYLWECDKCGWWEIERIYQDGGVAHEVYYEAVHHQAIAKRLNIKNSTAPTNALIELLKKSPGVIYGLNKRKMEEVVQHVFSSFYDCDVKHCGKSHDGGVDLVMISSDEPTLIQVKCRESKYSVEPISQIRDFLGAMWINKARKGIYVTTADHYSSSCTKTINQMISDNTLKSFEMIDFERFVSMPNVIKSPKQEVWRKIMNNIFGVAK